MIKTESFEIKTEGDTDIINITSKIEKIVGKSGVKEGSVTVFVAGSTAGLSIIEHEPGHIKDLKEIFEEIAPVKKDYAHHETWHDDNGSSHIRAALLKPSIVVPFVDSKMVLGKWQNISLFDFDTSERTRKVIVQVNGD